MAVNAADGAVEVGECEGKPRAKQENARGGRRVGWRKLNLIETVNKKNDCKPWFHMVTRVPCVHSHKH